MIRRWAERADKKKVNFITAILVIISLGLYGYLGHLLTKLMSF